MKKAPNRFKATHSPSLQEGKILGGGWRIKELKTNRPARHDFGLLRPEPTDDSARSATVPGHQKTPQRRRWCHPFGVLASMSAAGIALIMVADVSSPWLDPTGVSQPANAETHTSSTSTQGQKTTALQVMSDDGYQLYLGAYRSELGARLMWVGLEADPGTLLNGLDPSFKRQQGEGGAFYHVLAGTYARHDVADSHCAWLKEHEIACSIVGG